jgi:hypothetical protein
VECQAPCSDGAQPSGRVTVGDIARAHGAALRAEHTLTPEQHHVLGSLERCRTAALGGHKYVCDGCGYTLPMYNSCRNRHCPTCQSLEQHRWLERRRETILPVPYFHLVFTLPSELRAVVAMNRERMFAVMFEAASKTVLTLSRDKKRLGGTPALTMVLHTWTRDLRFHPHIHAIVSAGAMNEQGQWVHSRKDYLFPVKVMARLFRRFVREAVLAAIDNDELVVRKEHDAPMRRALFETRWVVYAKAPFGGAEQVFSYLGRYTHRVGISNARILYADAHRVTFATKNGRTCTLRPVEFLRRFLLHVLPRGFHKIRHYGLCSTHHLAHGTLAALRDALAVPSAGPAPCVAMSESADTACQLSDSASPPQTWVECLLALTGVDVLRCPRCAHGRLVARPFDEPAHQARLDTS